jgi:uncharacterized membrane protein
MDQSKFSSNFIKDCEAHFKVTKLLWLIIPFQIAFFSALGFIWVKFISKVKEPFITGNQLHILTIILAVISFVLVLVTQKIFSSAMRRDIISNQFELDSQETIGSFEGKISEYLQGFKVKAVLGLALCESPTMMGFVLTVLSNNHIYALVFGGFSFIGWKLFYFSPSSHKDFVVELCQKEFAN